MMENNDSDSFNPSDYSGDENSVQQAAEAKARDAAGDVANPLRELEQAQIICVIGTSSLSIRFLFLLRAAYKGFPGGPGGGKSTQCEKLAKDLSAAHLSVGDLLRAEAPKVLAEEGTDIMALMREGKLVPKEVVQEVLKRCIDGKVQQGITRILLDGFPRSMDQMTLFESSVSIQNSIKSCSSRHLENANKHAGIQDQSSSVLPVLQRELA